MLVSPKYDAIAPLSTAKSGASNTAPTAADTGNRFLALLVAQLKNQDPLNPLDNAQVTSQMAQINTVQGIGELNVSMTQMLNEFQNLQAVTLAGRDILVAGNTLNLSVSQNGSAQAGGGYDLSSDAGSVKIEIKDAAGNVVRNMTLGSAQSGAQTFGWDGLDDAGKPQAAGAYTFTVNATTRGQSVPADSLARAHVNGVANGAGGIRLNVGSYGVIGYGDVRMVL
jgi:flagellar basal-body rod modification protein FlgD